ncbi:DUF3298 domain-containing protein [Hymenobacter caeli]|uniref:DUF3298 domain-containing protein n=1 Tax=Hymenobacter caeli TaxID=2735894 RepID=A0ABX2FPP6_9BACT|nr:DUF3298 and DUF4163 domain-containing protein [Hymenobacter caeli]NRT19133.1 hypothetical protein [Hymenobacter caeli]
MKRFCRLLLVTAALGAALAACHSDSKPRTPAASAPAAPGAPATAPPASATNSPGASYRMYRGQLPGAPDSITLHLLTTARRTEGDEMLGSFATYAGADGHPYQLLLHRSAAPDSLVLEDISPEKTGPNESPGPLWRLRRQGSALVGTYQGRPLRLREAQPAGTLALAVQTFADSVEAFPGKQKSPWGQIDFQAVVPTSGPAALADNVLRRLNDDTLPGRSALPPAQIWARQRQQFRTEYREAAADSRSDAPADTAAPYGYGLRYQQQVATYVLWNQAPLLSLGYFTYSFSGGAHGGYATRTVSYDTRTGQPLTFAAVFRPGARPRLGALLEAAVRRTLRIPAGQPLDEQLLVKKIPVTTNFYLTSGGAVFTYGPYEIASYAQGEISVFIPMADLQPLLLPAVANLAS